MSFLTNSYRYAVTEELCQLLSSDYDMVMYYNANERLGVKLLTGSTWIGKTINTVKFWLKLSAGSLACYGRVYRDGTTDPIHTFGEILMDTIDPDDWEEITFSGGDGNYTLLENDIVCVVQPHALPSKLFCDVWFDSVPNYLLQMRFSSQSWGIAAGESVKLCIS